MTENTLPPVGVSITVPFTGYVSTVKDGLVTLRLRNGDTLQVREPVWSFALPDWLPARFGDLIESSGDEATRYLYIGNDLWVNSDTGQAGRLTADEISRCRLLTRSN